jgi:hypothetical protein
MPAPHHRTDSADRSYAVRIPADVDREDRVLANLTARQVAILATVGALLYAGYAATRTVLPPVVFLVAAVPAIIGAGVLVLGTRDGLSLDRLVAAAIRQRLTPRVQVAADGAIAPAPDWATARAVAPDGRPYRAGAVAPAGLRLPARAVDQTAGDVGVVDLGPDGLAVVCVCSTVNFALRTDAEQEALVSSFGRYLHSLSAPIQILIRAQRLDLTDQIAELRERAGGLPHPALEAAAREHADYLAELVAHADLLRRQVLLVLREPEHDPGGAGASGLLSRLIPTPRSGSARRVAEDEGVRRAAETRLARRVAETAQLLAPAGIVVTPLDAGQATAVLASACNPDTLMRPDTAFAAASDVVTLTAPDSPPDPNAAVPDPWGTAPVEATDPDSSHASANADDEMWWAR